jgi:FtsZ-binding cell division protein ZapB
MSESYGTGVAEEVRAEQGGEPGTLAMSANEFAALEERVLRAVNLVKRERLARAEAEERAVVAEARVGEHTETIDNLHKEIGALRAEREAVKQRVDKILSQLDALEA